MPSVDSTTKVAFVAAAAAAVTGAYLLGKRAGSDCRPAVGAAPATAQCGAPPPGAATAAAEADAVAESILALWFAGDLKQNYHRKWFAPPDSAELKEIDHLVKVPARTLPLSRAPCASLLLTRPHRYCADQIWDVPGRG
jgi:hypothetical protein